MLARSQCRIITVSAPALQVWLEKRYVGSQHTSEWFNTAGRSVKTGLIASVIASQVHTLILLTLADQFP